MEQFAAVELTLKKDVRAGSEGTLLSLFSADERFKRMEILADGNEGEMLKVVLEGLGEADFALGDDMEKGQKKSIMTLFWFSEKSKPFVIKRDGKRGEKVSVALWKG